MSYKLLNVKNEGRVELHDALGLSGAEISINKLGSNQNVPFVHSHKENEEIYSFFEGNGVQQLPKVILMPDPFSI